MFFDWRPVGATPLFPSVLVADQLQMRDIKYHVVKFAHRIAELSIRAMDSIIEESENDIKKTDFQVQFFSKNNGFTAFKINISNECNQRIIKIVQNELDDVRYDKEEFVPSTLFEHLVGHMSDHEARFCNITLVKFKEKIRTHFEYGVLAAVQSEFLRRIAQTIKENERHSFSGSEIYFLYSDRRQSRHRRYFPDFKTLKIHRWIRGAFSFLGGWTAPPMGILNRLQLVDADYVLRHDPFRMVPSSRETSPFSEVDVTGKSENFGDLDFSKLRLQSKPCLNVCDVSSHSKKEVDSLPVAAAFRALFIKKFEVIKRRVDLFVSSRETNVVNRVITLMGLSFFGAIATILGLFDYLVEPTRTFFVSFIISAFGNELGLWIVRALDEDRWKLIFIGLFLFLIYRGFAWLSKMEMLPSIDLLRSAVSYALTPRHIRGRWWARWILAVRAELVA